MHLDTLWSLKDLKYVNREKQFVTHVAEPLLPTHNKLQSRLLCSHFVSKILQTHFSLQIDGTKLRYSGLYFLIQRKNEPLKRIINCSATNILKMNYNIIKKLFRIKNISCIRNCKIVWQFHGL